MGALGWIFADALLWDLITIDGVDAQREGRKLTWDEFLDACERLSRRPT